MDSGRPAASGFAAPTPLNGKADPTAASGSPCGLGFGDELANIHAYVPGYGTKKRRRDVSALVEWDRRNAPIWVAVLAVRAALTNLNESETDKDGGDFPRLQNGNIAHSV
jgi:hypothetical protein